MPPPPSAGHEAVEEWTVVKPRTRGRRRHSSSAGRIRAADSRKPAPPDRRPVVNASSSRDACRPVAEIAAEYERIRASWTASEACAALRRIAAAAGPVSRAVCLGIGTFDPPDGSWDAKRRTFLQLVAFLVMVQELEKHSAAPIACTFQEPAFSASDRAFITSLGHAVVDSPAAFALAGPRALLFGVHLYRPVYARALPCADSPPAIFVGTGWDVWDQLCLPDTADLEPLRAMHSTHTVVPFPSDPSTTAFSSTSIYYRAASQVAGEASASAADDSVGRKGSASSDDKPEEPT
ncbi:hypothetical protein HIM_06288 [Hirsutella minnesotensis 3608]|uniref:SRR1-like domain-containing protein n=1 Tax=Hirsutella minnesotensis 3608 TaxID=1043627 RepID=A0A0F7ZZI5_9HYPO|nr:hypothetical protein HIM_06288 [Hirsutella minnesotensis 3608]